MGTGRGMHTSTNIGSCTGTIASMATGMSRGEFRVRVRVRVRVR